MLGKLFEILIASKAGALSGVLLMTGVLVSVTTSNGTTTVTLQDASPTPAATVLVTPTPTPTPTTTASPTASPSASPSESPKASHDPSVCAADAHARNEARGRIRSAYVKFHTDLMHLRGGEHGRLNEKLHDFDEMLHRIVKGADEALRDIGCHERTHEGKDKDRDNDNDEDEDERGQAPASSSASPTPTPTATSTPTATPTPTATTSTSSTTAVAQMNEIADKAIAAMETVFNAAKAFVDQQPSLSPTLSHEPKHGEHGKHHGDLKTPEPKDTDDD